jgi:hypothetical protein
MAEEIDLLFASDSIWVWNAEKEFLKQKAEHMEMTHVSNIKEGGQLEMGSDHGGDGTPKGLDEQRVEAVV